MDQVHYLFPTTHSGPLLTPDRRHDRIFTWLAQHAGFPGEGSTAQDAFRQAALDIFAK